MACAKASSTIDSADRPRALIQMATGADKTYTARAFTYRLIKFASARGGLIEKVSMSIAVVRRRAPAASSCLRRPVNHRFFADTRCPHCIAKPFGSTSAMTPMQKKNIAEDCTNKEIAHNV